MTIVINGSGTITGLSAGGLPDASVTTAEIANANVTQTKLETLVVPIGVGQTWTDVAGSRAVGTTYTNTTGRPIQVQVCSYSGVGNNQVRLTVGGLVVSSFKDNDYYTASAITPHSVTNMAIVPAGSTYSITNSNTGTTIQNWVELR